MHISANKELALASTLYTFNCTLTAIYYDGSGFEGSIDAFAILYIDDKEAAFLKYFLSLAAKYIVYKVEAMRLSLSLHLLSTFIKQL